MTYEKPINPQIISNTNWDNVLSEVWTDEENQGLNIREHFAGLAMQAIRSNPNNSTNTPDYIAQQAVKIADALIIELKKPFNK